MVAENDPSIVVERVALRRLDVTVDAYAAYPSHTLANTPSVVIAMHVWGVDEPMREAVRRLAAAGFAAICPNLFARLNAPSGDGATDYTPFRSLAAQLDRKQYGGDLRAGALWMQQKFPQTKVGVLGFCMGGRIAMQEAIDNGDVFASVATFYGAIKDIDPAKIQIPLVGSYGARDTSIVADGVRTFRGELHVPNDVRVYNSAGHAFCDASRDRYVASAAEDAWKRTITFLREHLGQSRR